MADILDFNKDENEKGCVAKNCVFAFGESPNTVCRRNPPQILPLPGPPGMDGRPSMIIQGIFPPVMADTICGEYISKLMAGKMPGFRQMVNKTDDTSDN